MTQQILITGMSGLIGGIVQRRLQEDYTLSALNRRDVPGVRTLQADIADLEAIQPAFEGQDVVVHLAASIRGDWREIQRINLEGTYNVFEAARRAGVKRLIYASSGSVIAGWEKESPYGEIASGEYARVPATWPQLTHETPVRPVGLYGSSKAWGEALARHYTDTFDLSIICLRIGHVTADDRPKNTRDFAIWCSHGDIGQMVERCVTAPADLRFDLYYAVSDNRWGYRDVEHARDRVGFIPQDRAEDYR